MQQYLGSVQVFDYQLGIKAVSVLAKLMLWVIVSDSEIVAFAAPSRRAKLLKKFLICLFL